MIDFSNIPELISKEEILKLISEEEIFELVFGFTPVELEYICSPFRKDKNPGCRFEYSTSGRLKFIDWGSNYYIRNTKMHSMDCFDAVKLFYNLPNFYETLVFIYKHFIVGREITERVVEQREVIKKERKKVEILIDTRDFTQVDANYWKRYEISKKNLVEDKVFALKNYKVIGGKSKGKTIKCWGLSYAYTDFEDSKKKIYTPFAKKYGKFITNLTKEDITGVKSLSESGNKLLITKSYKDWRVLKNQGYEVIAFQNEGMFPTPFTLLPIISRFKDLIIIFDNDEVGRDTSQKLLKHLVSMDSSINCKSIQVPNLPKITDPADWVFHNGSRELKKFLKENV